MIQKIKRIIKKQKHPLHEEFQYWKTYEIHDDVLFRPEYAKFVAKAKKTYGKDATKEQILNDVEQQLEKLK